MKVLFFSSGNSENFSINPFIKSQGESLAARGVDIIYLTIEGRGLKGYLKGALHLRKFLKNEKIDIIHAHYVLSGWGAVLSFSGKPVVLSLLGSDANGAINHSGKNTYFGMLLIASTYLIQPFVHSIIYKTERMGKVIYMPAKSHRIPNGVNLEKFKPADFDYREELGLASDKKYLLFLGNIKDPNKNYKLAFEASSILEGEGISLIAPFPVSHDKVLKYLNSVDLLLLTSYTEGSPNVVKEAMACNCPVIATDVGDVNWLFGNEPGYIVTDSSPEALAENIKKVIALKAEGREFGGRKRLLELGLDEKSTAEKIINIYKSIIYNKSRERLSLIGRKIVKNFERGKR